ncbi:type VI secretion system tube protein Hcp [Tenggerimyces flavus]|uniref:Type VI secretion system tube protein Hcp n=1 Tax=Tenggerimyces flavus TaxID=1708749 RepID=A0ABV7Y6B2_9ACTN|nr:type VI secretion system tube protein Hcp [Tenggerimyces flavus]MBM7788511.1 type VI protein secretion system component Hcp [Tenggerimyces flavus]
MHKSLSVVAGFAAAVILAGGAGVVVGSGGWRPTPVNAAVPSVATPGVPCESDFPFAAGGSGFQLLAKLDGVVGPVTLAGHVGDFQISKLQSKAVSSIACGTGASGGGAGGGTGKPWFEDLVFTKPVDIATPKLIERVAVGTHSKTLKIAVRRNTDGHEPLRLVLSDVVVVSDSLQWMAGAPVEQVRVTATRYEWEVRPNVNGTGAVKFCFDVKTLTKC